MDINFIRYENENILINTYDDNDYHRPINLDPTQNLNITWTIFFLFFDRNMDHI